MYVAVTSGTHLRGDVCRGNVRHLSNVMRARNSRLKCTGLCFCALQPAWMRVGRHGCCVSIHDKVLGSHGPTKVCMSMSMYVYALHINTNFLPVHGHTRDSRIARGRLPLHAESVFNEATGEANRSLSSSLWISRNEARRKTCAFVCT
jgi:hypothetical protein